MDQKFLSAAQRIKIISEVSESNKTKPFSLGDKQFLLNKHTLVPHVDTFQLILLASKLIDEQESIHTIADVGTGSGIIALSLAASFPHKKILASDISAEALQVAQRNAALQKVKNVRFFQNLDQNWLSEYEGMRVDLIISNPPFVGETEFSDKNFLLAHPEVKLEPKDAIVTLGDAEGFSPYLHMLENSKRTKTKFLLFQCNAANVQSLASSIRSKIDCRTDITPDKAGNERFLLITT